jgi:hypothetical protein
MHGSMCGGMGGKILSSYCYHTMIASTNTIMENNKPFIVLDNLYLLIIKKSWD